MKGDNEGPSLRRESQYEHLYSFRNMKEKKKPATIWWLSTDWATKENEIMKWTNEMKQQMKVKEYYSCSVN